MPKTAVLGETAVLGMQLVFFVLLSALASVNFDVLGETAVLGMQLVFFVLLSALASVNFDVCSIDFVMLLLNGVPFSIFVLKQETIRTINYNCFACPENLKNSWKILQKAVTVLV